MDGDMERLWGSEAEEVLAQHFSLHKACRDGDPVTLSRLVAEANPEQLLVEDQFNGWTPIHWAAYFGKSECLNGLLHCGVNVNIQTSKCQQTPLHTAAFGARPRILYELLKSGADSSARDYLGETSLHKAARVGNLECVKLLASCGVTMTLNRNGQTAYDIAKDQHFDACAESMQVIQKGNHPPFAFVNGHSVENGSSGSPITCFNGHSNGLNGHDDLTGNRKRNHDDIAMPMCKRARTTDCGDPLSHSKFEASYFSKDLTLNASINKMAHESEMEITPHVQPSKSHKESLSSFSSSAANAEIPPKGNDVIEHRGIPQYEDEVFSCAVDLPPGFWTSVAPTDYSHPCDSY